MQETISQINTLYTVLTLIFACGVSYATIKISLKSMTEQVKKLEEKVERLEESLTKMKIEEAVSKHRYEDIRQSLSDIDKKLSKLTDFYLSLEKRGVQRWQQEKQQQM